MELRKRTDDSRFEIEETIGVHRSRNDARACVPGEDDAGANGRRPGQGPEAGDCQGGHGAACSVDSRCCSREAGQLAQDNPCQDCRQDYPQELGLCSKVCSLFVAIIYLLER